MLLGGALGRSELAALEYGHIQQRDRRWVFVDLVGKGKRIRTICIPPFVKVAIDLSIAIDAWTAGGACYVHYLQPVRWVTLRKHGEPPFGSPDLVARRVEEVDGIG